MIGFNINSHFRLAVYIYILLVALPTTGLADSVVVSTVAQFVNAIDEANNKGGDRTIFLEDGTYTLSSDIWINAPDVTIAGQSGNRESVVIQGDAMSASASVGSIITIAARNFEIRNVTLQKCRWHLIQILGQVNADNIIVKNCILRDSYEQLLKVTANLSDTSISSDNGLVEDCLFDYTAGIGPQYYIGGIDAHAARNWVVRGNTFRNIISPGGSVAEFAIHFWSDSANNIIEKNLIINCDRGIGFGLYGSTNSGGIIRNNMIYHADNKGQFADVGIALAESQNSMVYNNTVYMEHDFQWAIEYRFAGTVNALIANNLTNKIIISRDGGVASVSNNITVAESDWFIDVSSGDLHLASSRASVVDAAQSVTGLVDDFDSETRPQDAGFDIGADEFTTNSAPRPPRNLRLVK
jgi:hypothetical protein